MPSERIDMAEYVDGLNWAQAMEIIAIARRRTWNGFMIGAALGVIFGVFIGVLVS
jgi:ABC-type nitrate/sulfonate/bicarbonate transport system permease component